MTATNKPPIWFWVVSVLGLLWNLSGVANYLFNAYAQEAILETLNQAQRELFEAIPAWATACFALAVFSGSIGGIGLLLRKKWAKPLFIISLVTSTAQFIHWLFVQNAPEVFPNSYTMPLLVTVIGIGLILFSNAAIKKGWIS